MIRLAGACLALAPGLVALAAGEASVGTVLFALAVDCALALLGARLLAGQEVGPSGVTDVLAWLAGSLALLATTLLSCPIPAGIGTATPGRRAVLVLAALVAAAAVAVVLRPARAILRAP